MGVATHGERKKKEAKKHKRGKGRDRIRLDWPAAGKGCKRRTWKNGGALVRLEYVSMLTQGWGRSPRGNAKRGE